MEEGLGVNQLVRFQQYLFELPQEWLVEEGEQQLLSLIPDDDPAFAANLVVTTADDDADPVLDAQRIAGSVVLAIEQLDGSSFSTELVFGFPLPLVAVTVAQLVGRPSPEGRLVATFSANATRFADRWPSVRAALQTIEVTT